MSHWQTIGPPFVVDGPSPVAPRNGLLDVATILPTPTDAHWVGGVRLRGYSDAVPVGSAPCYTGSPAFVREQGGALPQPTFGPFTVYVPVTCSTFILADPAEFEAWKQKAVAVFEAREGWLVETELVTAQLNPLNPHLADDQVALLNPAPEDGVDAEYALELMEEAAAETASQAVFHVDPMTATKLVSLNLIAQDGAFLRTIASRTPVVVGGGYVGLTPDDSGSTLGARDSWAWVTGPIHIRRGGVTVLSQNIVESTDRATNEVTVYVERDYVVAYDGALQAAVKVDRSV